MLESLRNRLRIPRFIAPNWLLRSISALSIPGLLLATLFFAASLTPSLVPRTLEMQGAVSGLSLAAGYGVGVFIVWLWSYMEMPQPGERVHRFLVLVASIICIAIAIVFLRQASEWQNAIRALMELEPVDTARPFSVAFIAVLIFALVLAFAALCRWVFRAITHRLRPYIPRRVANVIGAAAALVLIWSVIDGVIVQTAMRAADNSFQQFDVLVDPDIDKPQDPMKTGSNTSLVRWEDLGAQGRRFVTAAPGADVLSEAVGGNTMDPIRVYVGLASDDSIEARAHRALLELQRVGAFERSVLVIATPTGRGWVDGNAMRAVEYLHRGDIATVAVQYSYLPSWLSLLAEPEYGRDTARALFREVYEYWTSLPRDQRPALYLHGLSLGALNSERSHDLYDVIGDPYSGALWSGPPYRSQSWREITDQRAPDSPAWLPRFRDGSVVRFTNQENHLDLPDAEWGPMRIVYLQYASDPITFFEPEAAYRPPAWMESPRGPDVSPELTWYPVVTMLQLAVDLVAGDAAPPGYGHVYAVEHYIDAWLAVSDPPGWTPEAVEDLKQQLRRPR